MSLGNNSNSKYDVEVAKIRKDLDTTRETYANEPKVKAAILPLLACIDLPKDEVLENLREELSPSMLICEEIWDTRVYKLIRQLLDAIGERIPRGKGVAMKKAVCEKLFEGDEEQLEEMSTLLASHGRTSTSPTQPNGFPSNPASRAHSTTDNIGRATSAIQQSFAADARFTRDMHSKEPLHVIKRRFMTAIESQSVPQNKQVSLLVHFLKGPAEEYFYSHIRNQITTLEEAFDLLDKKFNTVLNQLHTRNYLNDMTFDSIKRELQCSDMKALETIYQRIANLTPQARKRYTIEDAQLDTLYHATKGYPWARTALANVMAQVQATGDDWKFDQFKQHLTTQLAAASDRKPGSDFHDLSGFNQRGVCATPPAIPAFFSGTPSSQETTTTLYTPTTPLPILARTSATCTPTHPRPPKALAITPIAAPTHPITNNPPEHSIYVTRQREWWTWQSDQTQTLPRPIAAT